MSVWTCLLETEVRLHVSFHHGLATNAAHTFCFLELVFGFADVAQDKIIQIYKKQTNNLLGFKRCFSSEFKGCQKKQKKKMQQVRTLCLFVQIIILYFILNAK